MSQDLFLLLLEYLGVSLRTKWFPLFRRVREITMVNDEGWFALLQPTHGVLHELAEIPSVFVTPEFMNDGRRQHLVVLCRHTHR